MAWSKSQKFLIANGCFYTIYDSFTAAFLVPFILVLGASNMMVGVLGALPFLVMLFSEIAGTYLLESLSRKTVYVVFTGMARFSWLLIMLSPFLFGKHVLLAVIIFYALGKLMETTADPAWTTLASDLVPAVVRGKYFALRHLAVGIAATLGYLVAGLVLDQFPKQSTDGFSVLFLIGLVAGIFATWTISRIKEPTYQDRSHHSIGDFFTLKGDFEKFCIFMVLFNFGVMIGSPFFTVFYLKNLGMSYTFFVSVTIISLVSKIFANMFVGKLCDSWGDHRMALIGVSGVCFVPFLTAFITMENVWFIIPLQIFSGIVWAIVDLSMFNLLLDFSDPKKRAVQIAEYQLINAIPMVVAPLLGGFLADHATLLLSGIPLVFVIAGIIRAFSLVLLLRVPKPMRVKHTGDVIHLTSHIHTNRGFEHRIKVMIKKVKNYAF